MLGIETVISHYYVVGHYIIIVISMVYYSKYPTVSASNFAFLLDSLATPGTKKKATYKPTYLADG